MVANSHSVNMSCNNIEDGALSVDGYALLPLTE